MPYRRLPNTDKARLRSLHMALKKGEILDMYDLAFSQKLLNSISTFLPRYEHEIHLYQHELSRQVVANRKYQDKLKKARLYVSHFIQALNMAVMRGEIKPSDQLYLGLEEGAKAAPILNTELSVIEWGERVIEGNMKRIANGGTAIYCPSAANVKVYYEQFKDAYNNQKHLQNNTSRLLDNVATQRDIADELILQVWNKVEEKFANILDQDERIDACREYGLIYYYRKGEKI